MSHVDARKDADLASRLAGASERPDQMSKRVVPLDRMAPPERIPLVTQAPLLVGLVAVWLALWQHVDLISLTTGIVFAFLVVRVFYLPPVLLSDRFNLWWFIVLLGRVLWWILHASWDVAWLAYRPKTPPQSAIVKTHLHTDSDWLQTLAAEVNMLVPGSVVVEVDRTERLIYLHVLDADSEEKLEESRKVAFDIEVAIAMAFGSWRELVRISEARRRHGLPPLRGVERAREKARQKAEQRRGRRVG